SVYWRALRVMFWAWFGIGFVVLCIWAPLSGPPTPDSSRDFLMSLLVMALLAWAGSVLLVSLYQFWGAIYALLHRLLRSRGLPPTGKWRLLGEPVFFLAVALAAFAWMDYAHPAWWRELWKSGDQFEFDVTPGWVVIN